MSKARGQPNLDVKRSNSSLDKPASRNFLPRGLSGRLLLLTMGVIMLTEIFVFVPSVANFRLTWLADHFITGEATSLALDKLEPEDVPDDVRDQLLALTQTEVIVVRRDGTRRVLATNNMPGEIARHVQIREPGRAEAINSITAALDTLIFGGDRTIRIFGPMQQSKGTLELLMKDKPLRDAMLSYAGNVMLISLAISIFTALVVFLTLRHFIIRPLQQITGTMEAFSDHPEDASLVIKPSGRSDEIGVAEEQFSSMQTQLQETLTQQRHLADLGLAVSKINHDLRNILASASLFSDRLTGSSDPLAQRLGPRLVRTIDRAVDYTTSVLAYGKAGEALPKPGLVRLNRLLEDVAETLALDGEEKTETSVEWINKVDDNFEVTADAEQLFRVLLNLSRNAVQAMDTHADGALIKRLTISAEHKGEFDHIVVSDTGPGFPEDARAHLFTAFQTTGRNGGTGLGLAIASEIIRAHSGTILLREDDAPGATFEIALPASG